MASGNDMKAAQQSYDNFISMVKFATPAVALIALLVVILISN
ncbi:MAG: aa3-type cytochrome c oxidase subunit IV [Novosphingobium sp.]|nr:aa3-type cytochrome c oxidase subunit IV [Novosphingobium sp.]